MRLQSATEIEECLKDLHGLSECILLYIKEARFGTTWILGFDYVWDESGRIRRDLRTVNIVELRFHLVQEFRLVNSLSDSMLSEPHRINWGIREVGAVRLRPRRTADAAANTHALPLHLITVGWDDGRHIDITFSELEIKKLSGGEWDDWEHRMRFGD